ncbi:hypothetical protein TUM20985_24900 [Mycobacterium antarcticum]|uniref:hypothetical protein n=1 Tax=Mycolicibacterium sp. TUM20985 TaxID=3023370 RepID=UPI0025727BF4|nr:hypothetical protein [Mycolicibacterium sp. TUM20985]BDX31943.1 hypothetical protein TUM20985_24900 [Mycolicibacterium sp. TUM20985]
MSRGYSILREHSLPPLNLSVPESLAVLAGLGLLENSPYGAAARRARAKVLAISREDQLAPVDEALASVFVIDAQPWSEAAISLIPEAIALGCWGAPRFRAWVAERWLCWAQTGLVSPYSADRHCGVASPPWRQVAWMNQSTGP